MRGRARAPLGLFHGGLHGIISPLILVEVAQAEFHGIDAVVGRNFIQKLFGCGGVHDALYAVDCVVVVEGGGHHLRAALGSDLFDLDDDAADRHPGAVGLAAELGQAAVDAGTQRSAHLGQRV